MEPILNLPPDLPLHEAAPLKPVEAQTVTEWPLGTFVENLCALPDGSFAISVLTEARLDRVWPDGRHEIWIQLSAPPAGLARIGDVLYVCVGVPDLAPATLWKVDLISGVAGPLFVVEGAIFLNGIAALSETVLLANDSALGQVWELNLTTAQAAVWVADDRLTRSSQALFLPGANGLKIFNGHAYITSNSRALLCRIPIGPDGKAGALEVLAENLRGDDLALDRAGNLYVTTHIGHSLDRVSQDGERVSLGGVAEGLAGSTACAFGGTDDDRRSLYVTTTGGIIAPPQGVLQPARLVRLEIDAEGASLTPFLEGSQP